MAFDNLKPKNVLDLNTTAFCQRTKNYQNKNRSTEKKQVVHPLKVIGKTLSNVSTSLLNLFSILPTGVIS